MKIFTVSSSRGNYCYTVGSGILDSIADVAVGKNVLIVTDDNVPHRYSEILTTVLRGRGINTNEYIFKNGENSKNPAVLFDLLEKCAEYSLTRSDMLVALGGGVVTDICGLAASLYMRGIEYISLPTTMLCAVDASIGGKTAVDLEHGKNLCGTFYPPKAVICDTLTFASLPENVKNDGIAEIVKYAFIADPKLLGMLDAIDENIVFRCANIKANLIARDEFDWGERRLLNFGHTVGHAIEKCSNYSVSHGRAVAMGMSVITLACEKNGICRAGTFEKLKLALISHDLPYRIPFTAYEISDAAANDKKRDGETLNVCLISDVGCAFIKPMSLNDFKEFISDAAKELAQ